MALSSDGKDLNKITVSIESKNATLKQAFRQMESLAKLAFIYKANGVARYDNISYQASNIPVARLLEELLRSTDLKYEQANSNIIIKKRQPADVLNRPPTSGNHVVLKMEYGGE